MAEAAIRFELDVARFNRRLTQFVTASERDARQIVYETALDVLSDTVAGWPVAPQSGISRASWWGPRAVGSSAFQIGNPWRYSLVIEFGGYRGVGPKTRRFGPSVLPGSFAINQGIYPRQKPAAPLRRSLAKHYGDMVVKLKGTHQRQWGR